MQPEFKDSLGFTFAWTGHHTQGRGKKAPNTCLLTSHTCSVCVLHELPCSVFTLQSRSYYPCFVNEEIHGSERVGKSPKVNGGVWFQIWDFMAPKSVSLPLWNLFWGGRGFKDEATVFSPERLCPQSLFLCSIEVSMNWAEGRGVEGNIQNRVVEGGESSAQHLFANSLSVGVPDLWIVSCPRSCLFKRPAGVILFSGITQGG